MDELHPLVSEEEVEVEAVVAAVVEEEGVEPFLLKVMELAAVGVAEVAFATIVVAVDSTI